MSFPQSNCVYRPLAFWKGDGIITVLELNNKYFQKLFFSQLYHAPHFYLFEMFRDT